ncbi:hypothetical protein KY284_022723 [Solanum tuberosum]|nr:hypothetical protein KY284_022723 [Solanum tuberosum]
MASTVAKLRSSPNFINGLRRFSHAISIPPPLDSTIYLQTASSPSLVLPEHDNNNNNIGFMVPNSPFLGGSMELMAVPKKKVIDSVDDRFRMFRKTSLGRPLIQVSKRRTNR